MSDLVSVMETLAAQADGCVSCTLGLEGRRQVVWGRGRVPARILYVGEAPGEKEDRQGEPFVGPSGEMLVRMLASVGLDLDKGYVLNVAKCRPRNNRTPLPEEIEACTRRWLRRQVALVQPHVVVTLGAVATSVFLPGRRFRDVRGTLQTSSSEILPELSVFPLYHPAALLRAPAWEDPSDPKPRTLRDLRVLRGILNAMPPYTPIVPPEKIHV